MALAHKLIRLLSAGAMVACPIVAVSQNYPNKPLRILVAAAGGSDDITARLISQGISIPLGHPVVVESRGSVFAVESFARATADGYTLLVSSNFAWIGSLLQKTPYD